MTQKTKDALLSFALAIRHECDRGHIPDETGHITATANDLLDALEAEPVYGSEDFSNHVRSALN